MSFGQNTQAPEHGQGFVSTVMVATPEAVRRGYCGIRDGSRPIACLLFTGPTGVGKTELCRALAQEVYGSRDAMIRLDMTEYMEKQSVSRLIGAPPGYVGSPPPLLSGADG